MATIRCADCGKFTNCEDEDARCKFTPDSDFGPERVEWTCGLCNRMTSQPSAAADDRRVSDGV